MKRCCIIVVVSLAAAMILGGCWSSKLPAGDHDIYTRYKNEIAILQNPNLPTTSMEKYEAASRLADGVDFSFLRNYDTIRRIFGENDLHAGPVSGGNQVLALYYSTSRGSIRFVFYRYGDVIVHSEIARR